MSKFVVINEKVRNYADLMNQFSTYHSAIYKVE